MFILLPIIFTLSRASLENKEVDNDFGDERNIYPICYRNVTECKLEVIVNFNEVGAEYAVQFDCLKNPVINHPSMNVFKNVKSYKLIGSEVSLSEFGLRYLNFPTNVEQLELDYFCLEVIEPNEFADFSNLRELTLNNSIIHRTTSVCFEGLNNLKQLTIVNTRFQRMNIVELDDSVTPDERDFDVNQMNKLENITIIDAIVTNLSSIIDTFPQRLQFINIIGVGNQIPTQIRLDGQNKSPMLHSVVLRSSYITNVEICSYALLCYLDLSRNALTEKNLRLSSLLNLKIVDLSFNLLSEFNSNHINDCPNIMKLIISNNRIEIIRNDAFNEFEHLEYLDLSFNKLQRFQPFSRPMFTSIQVDNNAWDCIWLSRLIYDQPELYSSFKHAKVHNSLGVRGLPCHIAVEISSFTPLVLRPMHSTMIRHPVGLIQPHPTITVEEPYNVPSQYKLILVTIASGVFMAQILLLLYNRHRRDHFQPFYRRLPKDTASSSIRDTITTRTSSFLYEQPIKDDQETRGFNNIYEEIQEVEQNYDHLQFHRLDLEEDVIDV